MRFIIQVARPGETLNMTQLRSLLEGTGVELEESSGPILVNPALGIYVARGSATEEAKAKAERITGVQLFAEVPQRPTA